MNGAHPSEGSSALPAGTRLGEFEIIEVIGVGGFSIVYLARDLSLEREVSIKEYLPASLARRSGPLQVSVRSESATETFDLGLKSFVNEARILAQFDHPSLLKVYRFWEANGTAYMVMPMLRGRTLKEFHQHGNAPPDETSLRKLLEPLLGAVEMLHAQKVYHRDIAPDNIIVQANGRPILLDFGAARRVIGDHANSVTVILKPAYAPIEQYAESPTIQQGPWTDLYALGATLHFMLVGQPPAASMSRIVQDSYKCLAGQTLHGVSPGFLAIVDWMLRLWPADRPQTVAALRAALSGAPDQSLLNAPVESDLTTLCETCPPVPATGAPRKTQPSHADTASSIFARLAPKEPPGAPGPLARIWGAFVGSLGASSGKTTPQAPITRPGAAERTVIMSRAAAATAAAASLPDATAQKATLGDSTVLLRLGARTAADPSSSSGTGSAVPALTAAPALALTVTASDLGAYIGRKIILGADGLTIGRDLAAYNMPDPQWSRRHALIQHTADGIGITDLGSTNGTYVNGVSLVADRVYPLDLGALIRIGSTTFALTLAQDAAPASLADSELSQAYELIECLQASPKGMLYRGRSKRSGREVAIKILSPDYASFPSYRQRFAREAAIASKLQHPHICSLDASGETDVVHEGLRSRVPFVAYEIMGGGNLGERLQALHETATETIGDWIFQLAEALHHAHQSGVVHGNLKPSAVCFDEASNIYVTDFAIAGPQDAGRALMGAPAFMAPEQWEGADPQPASDQYALAVLAYLLLSGVRPYEGQESPQTRASNLQQPPPALHHQALAQQRRLSRLASQVIERALAVNPSQRHANVLEFGRELKVALRPGAAAGAGAQIFISYRRETSSGWVAYLADQLERDHGITAFVDTLGLDGAVKFPTRIQRAIENCAIFVCVLGHDTLQSSYVRQEIEFAFLNGKRMIPVIQEGFAASEAELANPATQELLIYDGVKLLDRQNIYVRAAVGELAQQIRVTLADMARPVPGLHPKSNVL